MKNRGYSMNQLNSIILEGNVVRQAEMSEPAKGFKVCKFPLAVNRFSKNPNNGESCEEVSFFDVEAYGKIAEICEKNSIKGRGVRVVGRLKQNRWKDASGKAVSKIFIIAEHIEYKPKFDKFTDENAKSEMEKNADNVEKTSTKMASSGMQKSMTEEETTVF